MIEETRKREAYSFTTLTEKYKMSTKALTEAV
jgi:hypothetical protein